jgi:hypothetical protein
VLGIYWSARDAVAQGVDSDGEDGGDEDEDE